MLRKKEKKTIASMIALLIGWPVGLDNFQRVIKGTNKMEEEEIYHDTMIKSKMKN